MGILALPQMLRLGYDRKIAIGVVCGGGSLGTMIPPSIVLIIYGLIASVSIADLFTAAVIPGVMLAALYMTYVLGRCLLNPELAPPMPPMPPEERKVARRQAIKSILLPAAIAFMVLGTIYAGIASVTEAAAMGVFGVLAATAIRRELDFKLIHQSVMQTMTTCGMIVWIGVGAATLVGVYNLMGGNRFVSNTILGLDAWHRCDYPCHDVDPSGAGSVPRLDRDCHADPADLCSDHHAVGL